MGSEGPAVEKFNEKVFQSMHNIHQNMRLSITMLEALQRSQLGLEETQTIFNCILYSFIRNNQKTQTKMSPTTRQTSNLYTTPIIIQEKSRRSVNPNLLRRKRHRHRKTLSIPYCGQIMSPYFCQKEKAMAKKKLMLSIIQKN